MTINSSISDRLEQASVQVVESSIPEDMTLAEWRALRPRAQRRRSRLRRARTPDAARHLAVVPDTACEHLRDSTSRYDEVAKQLTFLLVCPACQTETVIQTIHYEPRFEPLARRQAA